MKSDLPDWRAFEDRLAESLGGLEEDQFLVVSSKLGWGYVQFAAQGYFGLRAEAVSNHYLPEASKLSVEQMAALETLGWRAPTGGPREATPEKQPDGSPNFFKGYSRPVAFSDAAGMAVRTLADVYDIPHPAFLDYQAFDKDKRQILLPHLGLKRRPSAPVPTKVAVKTAKPVREQLLRTIREVSSITDLEYDQNGFLGLRYGSALLVIRILEDPATVRIASPVLADVETTGALVARLNDLNSNLRFARLYVEDGIVHATVDVAAKPYVAEHVIDGLSTLSRVADEIDEVLQLQFGGRTAFGEFRPKSKLH
ncbi:MAG: YbjN domain-containing protein [Pseudomonadota bacterium]